MEWDRVEGEKAWYVLPVQKGHFLDPDGLCTCCKPIVERFDRDGTPWPKPLVFHGARH